MKVAQLCGPADEKSVPPTPLPGNVGGTLFAMAGHMSLAAPGIS